MPIATCKFNDFMNVLLSDIISDISDDTLKTTIRNLYVEISKLTIGSNPRSIKRLLNSFVITDNVAIGQKIYTSNDILNNYIRLFLFILLCIENNNVEVYNYIVNLGKDCDFNDYIDEIEKISNGKDDNNFVDSLDSDEEYDINIIKIYGTVLKELKISNVDSEIIKKIFNVSSSAISRESNMKQRVAPDVREFNDKCNTHLSSIQNDLNNLFNYNFRLRKGSSLQHRPHLFYEDEKSKVSLIFNCIYDSQNKDSVSINIQYWGEKLKERDVSLYNKIINLNISKEHKDTTTGTQYIKVISFNINEFDKLKDYIKSNINRLLSIF